MNTENQTKQECWSADSGDFRYDSLGDLLDSEDELKAGDTVYVGEAEHPAFNEFIDAQDVLETMSNRAYDIADEWAEDFTDVPKEAVDELDALLLAWMQKHCRVNFWRVENIKPYVLTVEDCPQQEGA